MGRNTLIAAEPHVCYEETYCFALAEHVSAMLLSYVM